MLLKIISAPWLFRIFMVSNILSIIGFLFLAIEMYSMRIDLPRVYVLMRRKYLFFFIVMLSTASRFIMTEIYLLMTNNIWVQVLLSITSAIACISAI